MNEQFLFSNCEVNISKYFFDSLCWIMFSDFTDSIQIYANKSEITALIDDLSNWEDLNRQEIIFRCGEISNHFKKNKLQITVFNQTYNVPEIFIELEKHEIELILPALKNVLDNWD